MYSSLQIGRAFAAVLVLLFHLGGIMSSERYFGISEFYIPFSSGVEFFFVLLFIKMICLSQVRFIVI
ncbi:hypothetical protein [Aliarcobacter butzleri]|uniref:hypothetical protein n=1 Tax=Aliarcobacter butzleri TaxID=28197 RepID=UPI002B250CD5|nr:hypothetical protein [Aliarcobacter butzleri]